jgi:DNA topoisomerase-3
MTRKPCPECGKFLLSVNGKNGKMYVCQDRECGYRERLSTVTNARCPECHKKMELIGKGDKKNFVCKCGFRESQEQHKMRTQGAKNAATKAFTKQYLKNQNKQQDEEESEFAKLLRMATEKK